VLEFGILGPLEVVGKAGAAVRLGGPRQRATLAILLLHSNSVVSVDDLADALYAGAAPVTAVTQVQRQISELRKAVGSESVIETRPPGYLIRLAPDQLDLHRFERLTGEASQALADGEVQPAADLLREALGLWRGAPLADLAYESFAQAAIERLREIRMGALELRIEADLALARHAQLVGELEELVAEHPLREGLRGQLMLALYRSGRQAEALEVYRKTREALVDELGVEPTPALHQLERAILAHDQSLDLERDTGSRTSAIRQLERAVLVVASADDVVDTLLTVAEPLASLPPRELIIARLLRDEGDLRQVASRLYERRASLDVAARTAAFTAPDPAGEVVRLAGVHDVALVLLDALPNLAEDQLPGELTRILARSPADVAVLTKAVDLEAGDGVFVPFGGGEHDWAALELGAWLAAALGTALRLVGTKADPLSGRRDASRLLADASLALQRVARVDAEPLLAEVTEDALVAAVEPATLVVAGISPRWQRAGIGTTRRVLVRDARPPMLLVHRGPRPGGLAPRESRTRFTWSLDA
jgi:DNA-binding SARP family transcriptional activator